MQRTSGVDIHLGEARRVWLPVGRVVLSCVFMEVVGPLALGREGLFLLIVLSVEEEAFINILFRCFKRRRHSKHFRFHISSWRSSTFYNQPFPGGSPGIAGKELVSLAVALTSKSSLGAPSILEFLMLDGWVAILLFLFFNPNSKWHYGHVGICHVFHPHRALWYRYATRCLCSSFDYAKYNSFPKPNQTHLNPLP